MSAPIGANFGIYAFANFEKPTAQSYYRITVPLRSLYQAGLANIYPDNGKGDRDLAASIMFGADIALAWCLTGEAGYDTAKSFADMPKNGVMVDGALRLPPLYVNDCDDAVEFVHPLNSSYSYWGIRNWNGDILSPGDELLWPDKDGRTKAIWKDKETRGVNDSVFDIERNLRTIGEHYDIARMSAGCTVTTEKLAQYYREQGVKEVYVYPNSVMEEDYFFPNLAPHDGIRILWQGGISHFEDWMPVVEQLAEIANDNPKVTLVFWGCMPTMLKRLLKRPEQIEFHEWVDYTSYKLYRSVLDCDINLCPLVESPFNQAKSAIKFYEASIGPRPEATLAANVGPYKEIEDGKTGLLYNNPQEFKEKLIALIKNKELRLSLAGRARDDVRANRAASKTCVGLFEFYEHLRRKQRREALLAV